MRAESPQVNSGHAQNRQPPEVVDRPQKDPWLVTVVVGQVSSFVDHPPPLPK
jgi:hypothetical protein